MTDPLGIKPVAPKKKIGRPRNPNLTDEDRQAHRRLAPKEPSSQRAKRERLVTGCLTIATVNGSAQVR